MIKNIVQLLSERELPESQCCFRMGHADMTVTIRQLTKKAIKHQAKWYCVFVDLWNSHDSVPNEVPWVGLWKLGVPDHLIYIRSFYDNMKVKLHVDGDMLVRLNWRMV